MYIKVFLTEQAEQLMLLKVVHVVTKELTSFYVVTTPHDKVFLLRESTTVQKMFDALQKTIQCPIQLQIAY